MSIICIEWLCQLVHYEFKPQKNDVEGLLYNLIRKLDSEINSYQVIGETIPYAERFLKTANDYTFICKDIAELYSLLADAYFNACEYDKALQGYMGMAKIYQQINLFDVIKESSFFLKMSLTYCYNNEFDKAIEYAEKVLSYRDENIGQQHISRAYHVIGLANHNKSLYDLAIEYINKSLDAGKEISNNQIVIADNYLVIGLAFCRKGDYDLSRLYLEKSLDITLEYYGEEHFKVATCYQHLAEPFDGKGDYDKAIFYCERALEIFRKVRGAIHSDVAICLNNLGLIHCHNKDYDLSLTYYLESLQLYNQCYSQDHLYIGLCLNNLGMAYRLVGKNDESISHCNMALRVMIKHLTVKHSFVGYCYSNLAAAYEANFDYNSALSYYEQAYELLINSLPSNHSKVVETKEKIEIISEKAYRS